MTFDMEKAREAVHILENFAFASGKITTVQIQDILWGARLLAGASTEIERLRAENAGLSEAVIDTQEERDLAQAEFRTYHKAWEEQATRIQELEEDLVDARGKLFHQFGDAELDPPGEDDCRIVREMLQAEGKIGSWDHIPDVTKKVWLITDARRRAIAILVVASNPEKIGNFDFEEEEAARAVLQAMLKEAGQ